MTIFSQYLKNRGSKIALKAFVILLLILGIHNSASAAVLFERPKIGNDIDVSFDSGNGFYTYYQNGYETLANPPTGVDYWTVTGSPTIFRVKKISGWGCGALSPTFNDENGNGVGGTSAGATTTVYCDFPITGLSNGEHVGSISFPSVDDLVLDGSYLSDGKLVNGFNDEERAGGFAFQFCDVGGCSTEFIYDPGTIPGSNVSYIYLTEPIDGTVIPATSTPEFSFEAYISTDDEDDDSIYVSYTFHSLSCSGSLVGIGAVDVCKKEFRFDYETGITFNGATTTTFDFTGIWDWTIRLMKDRGFFTGFIFGDEELDIVRKKITIGQPNGLDLFLNSSGSYVNELIASTSPDYFTSCNIIDFTGSFNFLNCLRGTVAYIFVPSSDDFATVLNLAKEGFLSRAPFGYVTRFVTILSDDTASTTLPALSYTFEDDSVLAGETISFDPWNDFYSDGSLVKDILVSNTDDPKNIWEIMEPIINAIVYIALAFMIIKDLTKIHSAHSNREEL